MNDLGDNRVLGIILARAGSKGLAGKNRAELNGRPLLAYTLDAASSAKSLDRLVVSTDDPVLQDLARAAGFAVIERPAELATDSASVSAAARHALAEAESRWGQRFGAMVVLYGNVPLRPAGLIDRAVEKLLATGCDSVQSVAPVGKAHPFWMKKLGGEGGDRLVAFAENPIDRRQDLPPLYLLDGGVLAVRRANLVAEAIDPHAFLGDDRRAVVTAAGEVVDVDDRQDLDLAGAMLGRQGREVATPPVSIAGRGVGEGHPVYVIAELGVNHDGSVERALALTEAAAEAGASAVKLQLFAPRFLLSGEAELAGYQSAMGDPWSMLEKLQLDTEQMRRVRERARELGLGFVVTCFSVELVEQLALLDPDAVKIASPDCVNLPLIRALAELDRPILMSLGTLEEADGPLVERAVASLAHRPLVLLHCVSAYPVPEGAAGLGRIAALQRQFRRRVGYSDHATTEHMGMLAVAAGACLVEKHLTHDRTAPGPDHAASFEPQQFRRYVQGIELARLEMELPGTGELEADVRRVSRQSLCARRDLRAGERLERTDLTLKRPGTGIAAAHLDEVLGRRLARDVGADTLVRDADLER